MIGHMNKNSNGKSSYRGLGSIDFQAAARSVLIVGKIKDEPEIRVVCHVKSSLAPEGKSIAFRLDKETGFEWIGEYDISADDLLSGDVRGQKSRKAKEFLLEILASGGMAQRKIEEEAEKRGIKKKTLRWRLILSLIRLERRLEMREGRLGYNSNNGRYGILSSDLWIDTGLHCGECLQILMDGKWVETRMEMDAARNWYLVGTPYRGDMEYIRAQPH